MEKGKGQPAFPTEEELTIYFNQQGYPEEVARGFKDHYQGSGWKTARGTMISDWKCFARAWIKRERKLRRQPKDY